MQGRWLEVVEQNYSQPEAAAQSCWQQDSRKNSQPEAAAQSCWQQDSRKSSFQLRHLAALVRRLVQMPTSFWPSSSPKDRMVSSR